jgi:cytochrome c553
LLQSSLSGHLNQKSGSRKEVLFPSGPSNQETGIDGEKRTDVGNIVKKLLIGLVVGGALFATARALEFPFIFQIVFFGHALFGSALFILLDAPPVKTMGGAKAAGATVAFYILLCAAFVFGASLWPQFDPEDERGKIAKILESKRKATEQGKAEELLARAKALDEQVKALEERLKGFGMDQVAKAPGAGASAPPAAGGGASAPPAAAGDAMKVGEEQWKLQECYNCHKLRGEGGKKRGPELDNIGTLLTVEEIKRKIVDPKSYMATGFEKEWEKGMMPDKFKDVMDDGEMVALATWLGSFKNTAVNTPIPVKKK